MIRAIVTIARKEVLERLVTRRYLILLAVTALTMILAFVSGARAYKMNLENHRESVAEGGGHFALHSPSPLSILALGVEDELGRRFEVDDALGLIRVSGRSIRAANLYQVLPAIDVLYIVRVLLSLVAALLVFDAVAGEKQRGSLALLLSHAVSRSSVFAGKWLGGHIVLAAVLAPSILIGLLWIAVGEGVSFSTTALPRLFAFFALGGAYLSFFLTLGLMTSCLSRGPATSSVTVLLVWALLVFILPNFTAQWSACRVPLPNAQRMAAWNEGTWISQVFERIHAQREGEASREFLAHEVLEATGGLDRDFFARASRRVGVHKRLAVLSPASSLVHGAIAITGTGPREALRFKGDLLAYRAAVIGSEGNAGMGPLIVRTLAGNASWIREVLPHFLFLALGIASTFLIGMLAFNRYDPR